jgi:hypothetical protein
MASFKIAQNPTFKADVEIPRVNGETIKVPFVFKYRGRKDLAALFVGWQESAKAEQEALQAKGDAVTLAEITESQMSRQVAQVQELVESWGFDDELSEDNIRALVDTSSGAGDAIVDAYQKAFIPARKGN